MSAAAPALACRLTAIITVLCAAIAARAARQRELVPLLVYLWGALRRRAGRFERLAAKLQAGKPPSPRARRKSRPPRPPDTAPKLPRRFGWLLPMVPGAAAAAGSQLQALLGEAEMATLLEAAPQAGRLLRPLCRMLGVRPGPTVAPALVLPRRERKRTARPKPQHPPDLRPRPARPWQLGSFHLGPRQDESSASPAPSLGTPDHAATPCARARRPP